MLTTLNKRNWSCSLSPSSDFADRLNAAVGSIADSKPGSLGMMVRMAVLRIAKGSPILDRELLATIAGVRFRLAFGDGGSDFAISLDGDAAEPDMISLAVDLAAASQTPAFQLRRCFNDGVWFSPGLRSSRSKFCSTQCRMKFNYDMRSPRAGFVCSTCELVRDIDAFSGLSRTPNGIEPTDAHSPAPICISCIANRHAEWGKYLLNADHPALDRSNMKPAQREYAVEMSGLIRESLEKCGKPQHYRQIAAYVKERIGVQGDSPDLTVLGYILRNPSIFKQTTKHTFALANSTKSTRAPERASGEKH